MSFLCRTVAAHVAANAGGPPQQQSKIPKRGSSPPAALPPSQVSPPTKESLQPSGFNKLILELGNSAASPAKRNFPKWARFPRKKRENSLFKLAAALFCDALESAMVEKFHNEEQPSLATLRGNYAPTEEYGPSSPLVVIGTLPECLNGEFLRVGPNPKFKPKANYSWFDGDGMLHGVKIKDGKVSYTSRYVRTARLSQEEHYGAAMFIKMGDCRGLQGIFWVLLYCLRVTSGLLDVSNGWGTANTALVFHNRQLLCLQETDRPYSIRVHENGELETVGTVSYDEKLNHPFSAHPKVDPVTGEMFVLGCNLQALHPPFITYRVVSKGGEMREPVAIGISGPRPVMMHDFAITEHYAVFLDCPLQFEPGEMVLKNQGVFCFDKNKTTRIGILPRYAGDDSNILWFELPPCMILHTANAWEEGDEVVLIAFRSPSVTLEMLDDIIDGKSDTKGIQQFVNQLYEFRLNLKSGKATEKRLCEFTVDFPGMNPAYRGRKNRYIYTSVAASQSSIITGFAKFDLTREPEPGKGKCEPGGNLAGFFPLGYGRSGSEAVFVPVNTENSGGNAEEDEGYLLSVIYDQMKGQSEIVVIDAKTMSPDPVAVIQLPTRVPYGFHGLFVSEQELMEQRGY